MFDHETLTKLSAESRAIEGLPPTAESIRTLREFLDRPLTLDSLCTYVYAEAGTRLRRHVGQNVMVGGHIAPPGGPDIELALRAILTDVGKDLPWITHSRYLTLHPFMDGNGRSARAIYMHQCQSSRQMVLRLAALPLLQCLYYDALTAADERKPA